jgi:hypothetical protein
MAAEILSFDQGKFLQEARKVMLCSASPGSVIWQRHIRNGWQTGFKFPVVVALLANGDLRVTNRKTGVVVTQGPAWTADRLFPGVAP